jgi:broad specificity phosphatase PhoE
MKAQINATYRLQLQPEFGFASAADLATYLARLGISHVYTSPYLQAMLRIPLCQDRSRFSPKEFVLGSGAKESDNNYEQ